MIVYGTGTFKLKSYTLKDLGVLSEQNNDIDIQVRQQYFHIFWIPFCPIGKKYVFPKDGEYYILPDEITQLIKQKEKIKTPWYSFAIPVLALAIFIIYFFNQTFIKPIQRKNYHEKEYANNVEKVKNDMLNLNAGDIVLLQNEHSSTIAFEVVNIKNDELLCNEIGKVSYTYSYSSIYKKLKENSGELKKVKIGKKDIISTYCTDFETYYNSHSYYKGCEINIREADGDFLYKEVIKKNDSPHIHQANKAMPYKENGIAFTFKNDGFTSQLIQIKNISNDMVFNEKLPMEVLGVDKSIDDNSFSITFDDYTPNTNYNFDIVIKTNTGKELVYNVSGKNQSSRVYQVKKQ